LGRSLKGALAIVGGLNLGGSVELVHNPIELMELAMEKGAGMVLLPHFPARPRRPVRRSGNVGAFLLSRCPDALRKALNES